MLQREVRGKRVVEDAKQELTIIKAVIELKRIEWILFRDFCTLEVVRVQTMEFSK